MLGILYRIVKGIGWLFLLVLVVGALAWGFWGYSPIPDEPSLSSVARSAALVWDDRDRSYIEYVPSQLVAGAPLLVVLHGSAMNGGAMRIATGYEFDRLADRFGFAVVYPHGFMGHWNDCRIKPTFAAKREQIDDLGFIQAVIVQAAQDHGIDPERVFMVGYSNGGQMAFRFGIDVPHSVAGIAVTGASLSVEEDSFCNAQGRTAKVMQVNGTADRWIPYHGGEVTVLGSAKRGRVLSALDSAQAFAMRNGIVTAPEVNALARLKKSDSTRVTRHSWYLDDQPYVVLISIEGGGHVFPQQVYRYPRMYGVTTANLDLPTETLRFFGLYDSVDD